jgi:hypothetical protein
VHKAGDEQGAMLRSPDQISSGATPALAAPRVSLYRLNGYSQGVLPFLCAADLAALNIGRVKYARLLVEQRLYAFWFAHPVF